MTKFYSKTTGGFYDEDIHETMPNDAVEITEDIYNSLMDSQSNGKIIQADDNGNPIAVVPPPLAGNDLILSQILALEATQTDRRVREALAGTDSGWFAALNSQIAALRAQLT